ncbi:response regulator receiver domain protein [Leptospira broomii serovar Hurstbridge str. 5399]|uniref:Response regulator receiver domain protein n=1 Tax=Leptospira broomii serovar Hurstbridge str. 5399 TaxID=1049789 RepID=T0F9W0_9LEPT|nr:response regulator transcription factor [Leptospira broomii]EQA44352.1 response regulator receiver domain protein [Leptospira broomii serovar Hurstbridge str. 5399]
MEDIQSSGAIEKSIKIALIEDNSEFGSRCLQSLVEMPEISVADLFTSCEEFLANGQTRYDIVFVDIILPGMNGIDFIRENFPKNSATRFIVLSGIESDAALFKSMQAGAVGYFLKKDLKDISHVTRVVLKEGGILSPGLAVRVMEFFRKTPRKEIFALTPREREILDYINGGFKTKQIALKLGTKEGTVRIQIKSIFRKLKVNSRLDLVRKYS